MVKNNKPDTERADSRYRGMDVWPSERVLKSILAAQERSVDCLRAAAPMMVAACNDAAARLGSSNNKGRIVYIGAGTPARIGVQDGTELTPTFGWSRLRVAFVIAGGRKALTRAVEGAEDDVEDARRQIEKLKLTKHDICFAISASGKTPFTVEACKAAKKAGALTISIASNKDTPLLKAADYGILTETGPEPVAGSTRMGAGTAQTVALKAMSTLIMVRDGHVYDGYMVDVIPTNAKLERRIVDMVVDLTGCDKAEATRALKNADGQVKLATLIVMGNLDADEGRRLLKDSQNNLRTALASLNP